LFPKILDCTKSLYEIFTHYEATLVEIDPLIETDDHALIAGNARLVIDDNAIFKHQHLEALAKAFSESQESQLRRNGVYFVKVGGNIGLVCVGAGMSMATMDLVAAAGGNPACFCDISAGINPKSMELALDAVSNLMGVKSVLLNMFGGITRMDEVARSFIAAWDNMGGIPQSIVIRLEGTNVEEGRKIIRDHGFETITNLYEAVDKAVELGS
jgi:succinyl-CoA synthetase beta subunit